MQYTPGWCVGWFFIPIANLVMPYIILKELWQEKQYAGHGKWRQEPAPGILIAWGIVWFIGGVTHFEPLQVLLGREKISEFR